MDECDPNWDSDARRQGKYDEKGEIIAKQTVNGKPMYEIEFIRQDWDENRVVNEADAKQLVKRYKKHLDKIKKQIKRKSLNNRKKQEELKKNRRKSTTSVVWLHSFLPTVEGNVKKYFGKAAADAYKALAKSYIKKQTINKAKNLRSCRFCQWGLCWQ